jgi:LuxR family maltose regulon positive regulatory protein
VSAAAGSGKTTLLSAWLDELIARPSSSNAIKAGWLTLDQTDNQLPRFLRYLVAAIEDNFPHSCAAVTALLHDNPAPTIEALADALANSLALLPGRFMLVLDDLHAIDDAAIHALLARLVQFAPPTFHLVLSARVDPSPLPLNRWRAQGQLNELRQSELCFTVEEAAVFLEQSLGSPLVGESVAAVHKYTEGWPVGLRLAALALRGHGNAAAYLADVAANSDRFALDYLRDDVLDQQPEAVQKFLMCTAILKRFCPALCAAALGIDESAARQQLSYVERANLFLVDLSSPPLWFRYHHQFQSMLLSKLNERYDQGDIARLYRRAATWLADHGEIQEGLEYLTAIGDFEAATDLLESQRVALGNGGRTQELIDALTLIPERLVNERPLLLLSAAWIDSWRLEWAQCAAKVERAEHLLHEASAQVTNPQREMIECEIVALRCTMDHVLGGKVSLEEIHSTWARARPHVAKLQAHIISTLAERSQCLGDVESGLTMIATALAQNSNWPVSARCRLLAIQAMMEYLDCDLHAAERDFHATLHLAQQHEFVEVVGLSRLALGAIAGARHQLDDCERYLLQVTADRYVENAKYAMLAVALLIEIYAFQNRPDRARPLVEQFREQARMFSLRYMHDYVAALEAYLAMMCGDLPLAFGWALSGLNEALEASMYSTADRLPAIRARILLAEGSPASLQAADQLLQSLYRYQESQHRKIHMIEAYGLHALVAAKLGQMALALAALGKAVQLAVPNGIIGFFILKGEQMRRLLHVLSKQPEHAARANLLLAAFSATSAGAPAKELLEALSDRECDVLRLMAEGLSSKSIAQQLMISTNTVRNHTANIFSKLHTQNRLQAVERARTLGLLAPVAPPPAAAQRD